VTTALYEFSIVITTVIITVKKNKAKAAMACYSVSKVFRRLHSPIGEPRTVLEHILLLLL